MFPQPSSGDVEVPGTTIHFTIPYIPHLRIEGRDGSVDAGNIEPCSAESRVYLAWHRPRQQRDDKTETLIIQARHVRHPTDSIWLSTGLPRAVGHRASALAGSSSSARAIARGRSPLGRSGVRTTRPGDPGSFHSLVPPAPTGSYALSWFAGSLCQRFFFSGKAVEHEVVRYVGDFGVAVFLG